jgi:hypothetical protein
MNTTSMLLLKGTLSLWICLININCLCGQTIAKDSLVIRYLGLEGQYFESPECIDFMFKVNNFNELIIKDISIVNKYNKLRASMFPDSNSCWFDTRVAVISYSVDSKPDVLCIGAGRNMSINCRSMKYNHDLDAFVLSLIGLKRE